MLPALQNAFWSQLDNLRDKYGVKTMKLAKLVAQMYFPDKASKQYQQLVLHTDPVKNPSPVRDHDPMKSNLL